VARRVVVGPGGDDLTSSGAGRSPRSYIPPVRSIAPQPLQQQERNRTLATYKKIDVVGTSSKSVADAVKSAVSGAGKTLRNMSWFEVSEIRGAIKGGEVSEFQVTVRIGFKVES
jgi:flavin-binding protein dodecin